MKISLNLAATLVIIVALAIKASGLVARTQAGAFEKENFKRRGLKSLESEVMDSEQFAGLKRVEETASDSDCGKRSRKKHKRGMVRRKKFGLLGVAPRRRQDKAKAAKPEEEKAKNKAKAKQKAPTPQEIAKAKREKERKLHKKLNKKNTGTFVLSTRTKI